MGFILGDASEVYKLAADLSQIGAKAVVPARAAMLASGELVVKAWQANARATAGQHGVHYPDSIEAEHAFGVSQIAVDIGPNSGKPQGGMSFEFGSRNQPPHLDGAKALESSAGQVEALVTKAFDGLFG